MQKIELAHIPAYGVTEAGAGRILIGSAVTLIEIIDEQSGVLAKRFYRTDDLLDLVAQADAFIGEKQRELDKASELQYIDEYLAALKLEVELEAAPNAEPDEPDFPEDDLWALDQTDDVL